MKSILLSFYLLLFLLKAFGQQSDTINISWNVNFNNIPIILNDSIYKDLKGNEMKFETIKFYISSLRLLQNDSIVYMEQNSFHLVDLSDITTTHIQISNKEKIAFNKIKFNLGIDSLTNVSGAFGSDLDPTKGMYWTWQSGYINFKMEWVYKSKQKQAKNFEFHLGGYQHPFNSLQVISLASPVRDNLYLKLDVYNLFNDIDFEKQKNIMSPCIDAVLLCRKISSNISMK